MRVPVAEPIYVNPNVYHGESGTSDMPKSTTTSPIIYGENPNVTTNEYGEQVQVNETLIPTSTNVPLTPKQKAEQLVQDLKDAVAPTKDGQPKKDFGTIINDAKAVNVAKTTTPKKTTNYLLYGALGIGAVVILLGILKK
jgi:hypothetical protein